MARIVRKYGGSSLRDSDSIRRIARAIADLKWSGDEIVVVVSAMAVTTDELIQLAKSINPDPPRREMDMLLSVGERISCALLAMAIEAEGVGAASFTGSQVGIITDTHHGEARIIDIRPGRLLEALEKDLVVIVAGFQGVSVEKEITTLGRGGSDATAVALAAAIHADRCELMKDVDGLFTADPHCVTSARCIEALDFESALRLAQAGTPALQTQAAAFALQFNIPLGIGNSKSNSIGTIISNHPYDLGEVVGISKIDGLTKKQGCGKQFPHEGCLRFTEYRGRWVAWTLAQAGETAPYSGITVVTATHIVPELHRAASELLNKSGIATFGYIEQPRDYWICVETSRSNETLNLLHDAFLTMNWIRAKPQGSVSLHAGDPPKV